MVLVVGLAASVLSASAWYSYVSSLRRQAVTASLGNVRSILGTSLERDNDLLATVNALVATHPQITNHSLTTILSRLDLSQDYPGSIAFTYVEKVSNAGLAKFEAVTHRDPPLGVAPAISAPIAKSYDSQPGYCLTRLVALELMAGQENIEQMLLAWTAPYLSGRFNFCSSSFEDLLDASAATGKSTVSSIISLLRPAPGLPAFPGALHDIVAQLPIFIEISPVYTGPRSPTTAQGRAMALAGWTMGVFNATDILDLALANEKGASLELSYVQTGDTPAVLARAGRPWHGAAFKELGLPADPGWSVGVAVGPQASGLSPTVQAGTVLLGAVALTILLGILLNLLVASRRTALQEVEARTAELRHQALYDALTDLPNRILVDQRARELLSRARTEDLPIAVFFIDLDDFKKVNDTFGHSVGDELLKAVAARLSGAIRGSDTVGRLGGDEFVVLSHGSFLADGLDVVAERLLSVLREPFDLEGTNKVNLSTSASIGIAAGLRDSPEELLRDADIAMYKAKSQGKNCHVVFEQEMHEVVKRQLVLETELAQAFANQEFFLVYQPIIDLATGRFKDVEALLRWRHPSRGVIGPAEFIPVLESCGLIIDVGRFVLVEACRQAKAWHDLGHEVGVSVNVAARQLHYDVLIDHVREALGAVSLAPGYLTLEVTESMLMIDSRVTALRLLALSKLGVKIAIDDFGTGYASLSYLREFPADILKIDRSFVSHLSTSTGTNFLDALIHLGKTLGLVTIAEGIEENSQLRHLKHQGCDWGQGFLFSRPLPAEDIEKLILASARLVGAR
jgi:diguanylate cyclase (GGDEF)-like protein